MDNDQSNLKSKDQASHRKNRLFGGILRFAGWWLGFAGVYAMAGSCPCCGQVGCPVGASGAGIVGGLMALGIQNGAAFRQWVSRKIFRKKEI